MNFKLVWIDCNDLMIQKSARFVSFNISQSMNYEPVFFIFLYLSLDSHGYLGCRLYLRMVK